MPAIISYQNKIMPKDGKEAGII